MLIRVQHQDFDVAEVIRSLRAGRPEIGAVAAFVGLVRDLNQGDGIHAMTLEHYPGMTEKALAAITEEAGRRWELVDVAVVHRIGRLQPADQIVLVAVASAHRADAFAACEFIMDYLKTRAPFWKREETAAGTRWVEARDSDGRAAERWRPQH